MVLLGFQAVEKGVACRSQCKLFRGSGNEVSTKIYNYCAPFLLVNITNGLLLQLLSKEQLLAPRLSTHSIIGLMERNIVPIDDLLRTKCHPFSHLILLPYRGLLYLHYKGRKCTCEIPAVLCKGQKSYEYL